ncbi:MAG: hypothetical protein R3A52_31035 [Polyangiales bacterium]
MARAATTQGLSLDAPWRELDLGLGARVMLGAREARPCVVIAYDLSAVSRERLDALLLRWLGGDSPELDPAPSQTSTASTPARVDPPADPRAAEDLLPAPQHGARALHDAMQFAFSRAAAPTLTVIEARAAGLSAWLDVEAPERLDDPAALGLDVSAGAYARVAASPLVAAYVARGSTVEGSDSPDHLRFSVAIAFDEDRLSRGAVEAWATGLGGATPRGEDVVALHIDPALHTPHAAS